MSYDIYFANAGCSFNSQGIESKFIAPDDNNMFSPVGNSAVSAEFITSPEQISSITACSDWDLHSDGEHCDRGATFPHTSLNYLSQSSSQNYFSVQQLNQGMVSVCFDKFSHFTV